MSQSPSTRGTNSDDGPVGVGVGARVRPHVSIPFYSGHELGPKYLSFLSELEKLPSSQSPSTRGTNSDKIPLKWACRKGLRGEKRGPGGGPGAPPTRPRIRSLRKLHEFIWLRSARTPNPGKAASPEKHTVFIRTSQTADDGRSSDHFVGDRTRHAHRRPNHLDARHAPRTQPVDPHAVLL